MKAEVRVSAVQFAPVWLDVETNAERMRQFADEEAANGAELIVFPELANIGYITPVIPGAPVDYDGDSITQFGVRYARAAEAIPGLTTELLAEVARRRGCFIVAGIAQRHERVSGSMFNSGVLIGPAGVIGVHHKAHIPLNEKHFFYPGNTAEVWDTDIGRIGILICYDGRFPEFTRVLALKGAEIICNIWAIPTGLAGTPGMDTLKHRAYTRAQENGVFDICCNRSGRQGDFNFIGHSVIAAPTGAFLATSETDAEEVIRALLREEDLLSYRTSLTIFRDRRPELYGPICAPLSEPFVASAQVERQVVEQA